MPSEYGDKQSISVYIEKEYVKKIDMIALSIGERRSKVIADIIKEAMMRR